MRCRTLAGIPAAVLVALLLLLPANVLYADADAATVPEAGADTNGLTDDMIRTLPGVRADFPAPLAREYGRTAVTPMIDGGTVFEVRTVGFADAPSEAEGTLSPQLYLAAGVWVGQPHGLGKDTPDPFTDFGKPFGVRLGLTVGGDFAFRNRSLDVDADSVEDFAKVVVEFSVFGPWWSWGVGMDLVLGSWEFVSQTDRDLEFRQQTIPADSRIRQSITQYAIGVPIQLFDNWNWTLFDQAVPTLAGLYFRYAFLELGVETASPKVEGIVSSHVLSAGIWVDWGIARFLRLRLRVSAGGIPGFRDSFVAELAGGVTFTHIPPHWLDGRLEFLGSFEVDLTTHGFGGRYLHRPNGNLASSTVAWLGMRLRLGLRLRF